MHVALRFRPVTANVLTEAADAYGAFGRAYPLTYTWTDRRPIGTLFIAESAKGWPKNTNGWFNDEKLDVTTAEGRQQHQKVPRKNCLQTCNTLPQSRLRNVSKESPGTLKNSMRL